MNYEPSNIPNFPSTFKNIKIKLNTNSNTNQTITNPKLTKITYKDQNNIQKLVNSFRQNFHIKKLNPKFKTSKNTRKYSSS